MSDLDTTRLADFIALTDRMAATLRDVGERAGDPEAVGLADDYAAFKSEDDRGDCAGCPNWDTCTDGHDRHACEGDYQRAEEQAALERDAEEAVA
jgi:hypothetical protein